MICCNEECVTPFCPFCGKAQRKPHPLDSLLVYVRKQESVAAGHLKTRETHDDDEEPERQARNVKRLKETVERWVMWGKALEDMISKEA